MASNLMSNSKVSEVVTREQLAALPAPEATKSFKPVRHIELIETLQEVLSERGVKIDSEQFALRRDGSALFGVLDLTADWLRTEDGKASLGLRQANDKKMSIQIAAGLRVFICDNLAFNGDFIALKRKHTAGLTVKNELMIAADRFEQHFVQLTGEIEELKQRQISDTEAKALMHDVVVKGMLPMRLLPAVSNEYFKPSRDSFEPRTLWSLENAFTQVAKDMPVTTRIPATQEVSRYLRSWGEPVKALPSEAAPAWEHQEVA